MGAETWSIAAGSIAAAVVLVLFVGIWYGLSYLMAPQMDAPDGFARVTGNCGDTMEIGLKVECGIVVGTHCHTDGCSISRLCLETAARLAMNRQLGQLGAINMMHIIDDLGSLPDTHLHCAQLAEITLQRATADVYARKRHGDTTVDG